MHPYYDQMGFEEKHAGNQEDCMTKQCRRERRYYRSIPSMDPWPEATGFPYSDDPWLQEGI
jgi:hypothetical protein